MAPAVQLPLDELAAAAHGPDTWPQLRTLLAAWQVQGRALVVIGGRPLDVVSVATAATLADLPRPPGMATNPFLLVVFDSALAVNLERFWRLGNRPPT